LGERSVQLARSLLVGSIAAAVVWFLCTAPSGTSRGTRAATATADAPNVQQIYLRDCATCHGADARGTDLGPDLRGAGAGLVDYYLSTGRMPLSSPDAEVRRHDPRYPPEVRHELDDYVVELAGDDGPPIPFIRPTRGNVAEGGTLYRLQCAACHSWSGDGGALLHREAPSLHPATPTQIAEAVRGGPGNMPRFGDAALTNDQLQSLVKYVRYLRNPDDRGGNPLWHLGPLVEGAVAVFIGLGALVLAIRWIGTRT
jgi:ubiquinol-cytochrome c reductase cytochrome c subunit